MQRNHIGKLPEDVVLHTREDKKDIRTRRARLETEQFGLFLSQQCVRCVFTAAAEPPLTAPLLIRQSSHKADDPSGKTGSYRWM